MKLNSFGMANGGLAYMAEGGVPLRKSILDLTPITESAAALQDAYKKEQKTYADKGAFIDIVNRGVVADTLGGMADLANLPLQGLDYLQSKVPFLSKPASVMGDERVPKVPLSTDKPFAGSDAFREQFQKSGITSKTERPIAETATSLLAPLTPAVAAKVAKVGKALAPTAMNMLESALEKAVAPTQAYAVKPKGGNWLAGSIERATVPLKRNLLNEGPIDTVVNKWVDSKLGKYVKNEMGTPEDPIRLGIERRALEAEALKESQNAKLAKMESDIQKAQAAGKDTTLSQRDLAAARDKFDDEYTLASRGLYHGSMPVDGFVHPRFAAGAQRKRLQEGFPAENISTNPLAQNWETFIDMEIQPSKVAELTGAGFASIAEKNPFLSKLDPKTNFYELGSYPDVTLEFRHMIDEVRDAMDPTSNLPKNLRIAPKDLEKMTVDDVSALSGKISAWRDIQKTRADLQLANNPAVHVFKEYPAENNPRGVSWRQIKRPEGMSNKEAETFVREATKYEGDIMRHCVGGAGHCDPLLRGEVELYTLRDAKGEPHVTIEVGKGQIPYASPELIGQRYDDLLKEYNNAARAGLIDPNRLSVHTYFWNKNNEGPPPDAILEIKGKGNRKPSDEYIPFVQDFVKSGNWSSVSDLKNTDLVRQNGKYLSKQEIDAYLPQDLTPDQGMAKGGAVKGDSLESRINNMLANSYAKGGAVSSDNFENKINKMLAANYPPNKMADGGFINVGSFKIGGRIALIEH